MADKMKMGFGGVVAGVGEQIKQWGQNVVQSDPNNAFGYVIIAAGWGLQGLSVWLIANGYAELKLKMGLRG